MADDLSKRGQADRLRINVNEKHELAYWIEELGVSEPQLRELIHAHGTLAADVRNAIAEKSQLKDSGRQNDYLSRLTVPPLRRNR
jgi:hypothetical protein